MISIKWGPVCTMVMRATKAKHHLASAGLVLGFCALNNRPCASRPWMFLSTCTGGYTTRGHTSDMSSAGSGVKTGAPGVMREGYWRKLVAEDRVCSSA